MTRPIRPIQQDVYAVVLIPSCDDWRSLCGAYDDLRPGVAFGHEFLSLHFGPRRVVYVHTGDEPIEAAVSSQYAIDRWNPRIVASRATLDAYTYVAERNGRPLAAYDDLEL